MIEAINNPNNPALKEACEKDYEELLGILSRPHLLGFSDNTQECSAVADYSGILRVLSSLPSGACA